MRVRIARRAPALVKKTAGEPRQAWVAAVLPPEEKRCHAQRGEAHEEGLLQGVPGAPPSVSLLQPPTGRAGGLERSAYP